MKRNLKGLALVPVTVLALAASAQAANFTASSYPVAGAGGQTTAHIWTFQGSKVGCQNAKFTGSLSAPSPTIAISPSWSGCTEFGFVNSTIDVNGCTFQLATSSGSGDAFEGGTQLECPEGKEITFTAATCTVHIPAQTPTTNKVSYENKTGSPNKVLLTYEISGIHSKVTSGFLCPLEEKTTDTTGKYTGSTLFEGEEGVGIDIG